MKTNQNSKLACATTAGLEWLSAETVRTFEESKMSVAILQTAAFHLSRIDMVDSPEWEWETEADRVDYITIQGIAAGLCFAYGVTDAKQWGMIVEETLNQHP